MFFMARVSFRIARWRISVNSKNEKRVKIHVYDVDDDEPIELKTGKIPF